MFVILSTTADIFLRLENVPLHGTNVTKLCMLTLELESPSSNRAAICMDPTRYTVHESKYEITSFLIRGVDGNGYRLPPDDLNANLTGAGVFGDPLGSVVLVVNHWKSTTEITIALWGLFFLFSSISFIVAHISG